MYSVRVKVNKKYNWWQAGIAVESVDQSNFGNSRIGDSSQYCVIVTE